MRNMLLIFLNVLIVVYAPKVYLSERKVNIYLFFCCFFEPTITLLFCNRIDRCENQKTEDTMQSQSEVEIQLM